VLLQEGAILWVRRSGRDLPDEIRAEPGFGQDFFGVLADVRRMSADPGRSLVELDRRPDGDDLAFRRMRLLLEQVDALYVFMLMDIVDRENLRDGDIHFPTQLDQLRRGEVLRDRAQVFVQLVDALVALMPIGEIVLLKKV